VLLHIESFIRDNKTMGKAWDVAVMQVGEWKRRT